MAEIEDLFTSYIENLIQVLEGISVTKLKEMYLVLERAREEGRRVYICGNGGSAATASHMVCDLSKNAHKMNQPRLKAVGLADNLPALTAYANDEGYDRIFAEPIQTLMQSGDVLIAISTSGESENVIQGVKAAKQKGAQTIGLTGYEGGRLKDLVDVCCVVPSHNIERIEDAHLVIDHLLTMALRETNR